MFTKLEGFRNTLKSGILSRVIATLLGGTLNQRAFVVLGLVVFAGSIYYLLINLWQPLLVGGVGAIFVNLAVRDYERSIGRSKT